MKIKKLEIIRSETQKLTANKKTLQHEIEELLQIKDYVLQHKSAIANLEKQKTLLEKEMAKKSDRIALADTITNFLTRQSSYDFNRFYSMVETIKRAREEKSSPLKPFIPRIEEDIRMQALEAFEGDLVSRRQHEHLRDERNEYRTGCEQRDKKIEELEGKVKANQEKIHCLENENEILGKIKVRAQEGEFALEELKEWLIREMEKEFEKRVRATKFDPLVARTYGILEWIADKIANKKSGRSEA